MQIDSVSRWTMSVVAPLLAFGLFVAPAVSSARGRVVLVGCNSEYAVNGGGSSATEHVRRLRPLPRAAPYRARQV